ncbi:CBS domain-containing protein [Candidatus Bathyarchaeota archaeon]|nr:CBS domain-containing protein [Candidatus Bathyarchaeota archaeon]
MEPEELKKEPSISLGNNLPLRRDHGLTAPLSLEELMTREVVTVTPQYTLYEAAHLMGEKRIGSLLVLKYDTLVGIITERDLLNVVSCGVKLEKDWIGGGTSIREEKVESVMSFPVVKICSDSPLKEAARIMIEKRIRRLAVCDSGEVVGIVTAGDMIRSLPEAPEKMKVWFQVDYFMAKKVVTVDEEMLVENVAGVMAAKRVGSVIVTKQGKPKGIFTERDLLTKFLAGDKSLIAEVGDHCSSPLITAPIGMCIHEAAKLMTKNRIKRLPITKEKELIGVLSARDLVEAYARAAT